MGTEARQDSGVSEKEIKKSDEQLAEIIGLLLFNLSSPEVRRHILYKASILEAMGAFERAKKDPNYKPINDKMVADQLFERVEPLALSFVPEGMHVHIRRVDR